MREKKKINVGEPRFVCMQYDWVTHTLTLGGYSSLRETIDRLFVVCFGKMEEDINYRFTARNKIRLETRLNPAEYRDAMRFIEEEGYETCTVTTFDREM